MDRVRLRRATFELLEFSPVPPSSYLRMSPECTPRTSPSMFLRWTTPRRSTEMKRMTSRPRPGCSSVTRWSLGPPAMTVLAQRTKESQPTSQEGGEMAARSNRKDHRASFHPHHPWSLPSEQRTLSLLLCTIYSEFHNNNNSNRSHNFRQKSEVPPSLLTSYNGNNLTRMQRISVPVAEVNNTMKPFAKKLRGFMAGPAVSSYHCSVHHGAAAVTRTKPVWKQTSLNTTTREN